MSSVRPSRLALGFALYFGIVAYFAYGVARSTRGPWYTAAISQMVYQTTMVGGIIVLLGLLAVASFSGRAPNATRSDPVPMPLASAQDDGLRWSASVSESGFSSDRGTLDVPWGADDFFDDPDLDGTGYTSPRRAHDAAAVSAVLTRMEEGASTSASGALRDRLSEVRARETAIPGSVGGDMTQDVLRLVEEIRPLLAAAKEAGLDVGQLHRRFSEAMFGREGDLAYRLRIVEQLKATLESALSAHVSRELHGLLRDLEKAKAMTDQAHGAELSAAEAVALLDTGHYAAAFERAQAAREILERQLRPSLPEVLPPPAPSASFAAFVGPAFGAAVYVAIAAMLLPGVVGFLETNYTLNTGVILFLSYGWFGLILYAILSIYAAVNPAPKRALRWESFEEL
ncbi:MAG TPA: hypothetical protein VFA17_00495 [Thermoplasmata archaeon]|nr:hypothetical protein [Thermoplasmata archaeon]